MGLLLGLLAAGLSSAKDIASKQLSFAVDGTTSAFASFLFALPFYVGLLAALWLLGLEDFAFTPLFLTSILARSVSDSIAETCKMHALARGELSVIMAVISLHPVFLLFISPWITGDPLTPQIITGVLVTVLGSFVILFRYSEATSRNGIFFALLCALFFSINNCFDKLSVQSASAPFSAFSMTALACVILLPTMGSSLRITALRTHSKPFLVRGLFEVLFMTTKLFALQHLQAPELSAIIRVQLIFSVISGGVMFREVHIARKLLGAVLTVGGIVITLL